MNRALAFLRASTSGCLFLNVLDICLIFLIVAINYMQMLLDLMEERQKWLNQWDGAVRSGPIPFRFLASGV